MHKSMLSVLGAALVGAACQEPELASEAQALGVCGNGALEAGEVCVDHPGPRVVSTATQVVAVIAADYDADGRPDLFSATTTGSYASRNTGGALAAPITGTTPGADYRDVAAGDFDGDGDLDLALADAGSDRIIVRRNDGLSFPVWAQIAVPLDPVRVLTARMNADVRDDLVLLSASTHQVSVILAAGAGFAAPVLYAAGTAVDLALADCDGSGRRDVLYVTGTGTATSLVARRNLGNGGLASPLSSALPLYDLTYGYLAPLALAAGDLDGDGDADAVASATASRLAPALGDGACHFAPTYTPATMNTTWAYAFRLRLIDWDADGALDLGAPHGVLGGLGDEVYSVAFGDGAGHFPTYVDIHEAPDQIIPRDLAFLDLDGDGDRDLAVAADTGVRLQRNQP